MFSFYSIAGGGLDSHLVLISLSHSIPPLGNKPNENAYNIVAANNTNFNDMDCSVAAVKRNTRTQPCVSAVSLAARRTIKIRYVTQYVY